VREEEFLKFLSEEESITSKVKAVSTRLSKARAVENKLNVNLDNVVVNDDAMYETLLQIKEKLQDKSGNYQNALRKYYLFVNNKEFPSLSTYRRRTLMKIAGIN
jgi:hypothetical protein